MAYCNEYLELISAAVDGALSSAQQKELEAHLASCPGCRALYEDLSALHAAMAELPPVEVPTGLKERIMDAVAAEKVIPFAPKKASTLRWQRWLASAAVLALVVLGTWSWKPWESKSKSADAPSAEAAVSLFLDRGVGDTSSAAAGAAPAAPIPEAATLPEPASAEVSVPAEASIPTEVSAPAPDASAPTSIDNGSSSGDATTAKAPDETATAKYFGETAPVQPRVSMFKASSGGSAAPLPSEAPGDVVVSGTASPHRETPDTDLNGEGNSLQTAPAEAGEAAVPQSAPMLTPFSLPSTPQYIPYDATGELGQLGTVTSQAEAVNVLVNYIYEFAGDVELVDDGLEVNYAVNSPTGVSGVVTCAGEDEEVYLLDYRDDLSPGAFHYSVNKADSQVLFLGQDSAPEEAQP